MAINRVVLDSLNLTQLAGPGIEKLVMEAFKDKLTEKLNGIVAEAHAELEKELPVRIKAVLEESMHNCGLHNYHVTLDFRSNK